MCFLLGIRNFSIDIYGCEKMMVFTKSNDIQPRHVGEGILRKDFHYNVITRYKTQKDLTDGLTRRIQYIKGAQREMNELIDKVLAVR